MLKLREKNGFIFKVEIYKPSVFEHCLLKIFKFDILSKKNFFFEQ